VSFNDNIFRDHDDVAYLGSWKNHPTTSPCSKTDINCRAGDTGRTAHREYSNHEPQDSG